MPDVALHRELLAKFNAFHDEIPVFRVRHLSIEELERDASSFASGHLTLHGLPAPRPSLVRRAGVTHLQLPDNFAAQVFHASGAVLCQRRIPPMDRLFSADVTRERLTAEATTAATRVGLHRRETPTDQLKFEHLWQIKAAGITRDGRRSEPVLCRTVGAFRRHLGGVPVWGRASAFVKLDGTGQVEAAGLDWRHLHDAPVERARVIDPADAARSVLGELSGRMIGARLDLGTHTPEFFSLGYFSMPKQRAQEFFQPVFVARLKARGDSTLDHLIVVPASPRLYEPIARVAAASRQDRPKPATVRTIAFRNDG